MKLSLTNKILLFLSWLLLTLEFIYVKPKTDYEAGVFVGAVFAILFLAYLIATIFYFIGKKSLRSFRIMFNFIIVLSMVSHISQDYEKTKLQNEREHKLKNSIQELKNEISQSYINSEQKVPIEQYEKEITKTVSELSKSTEGDEEKFYQLMENWTSKLQKESLVWDESYKSFMDNNVFNFSIISEKNDLLIQRKIVEDFIQTNTIYLTKIEKNEQWFLEQIESLDKKSKYASGALKGFTRYKEKVVPIEIEFHQKYIDYGKHMLEIMDLVDREWDRWMYLSETSELQFTDADVQTKCDELLNQMIKLEQEIETLKIKLKNIITGHIP